MIILLMKTNRKFTDATNKEYKRFVRISLESALDYSKKSNRNLVSSLNSERKIEIYNFINDLKSKKDISLLNTQFKQLIENMQHDILINN